MRLIKKVEVNYLRSLYSASLDAIGDLNVIFGRNDSGKSNLLRALNLFFNDKTDPDRDLDFDLDMSDDRKKEARDAKGRQFIWIKVTFNVPDNYKGSLGEEIAIKRQWNRDGYMTQNVFPALESKGGQSRLTRFLNDIDFTYIPAIKDLTVFADLIERMYGAAADAVELQDATSLFVDAIEGQTAFLSQQLSKLFDGPAHLAAPTEMSRLFRNLDFAHGEEGHSLLRQKGDGVKARHLPELLRYINEKEPRKKFYLWGFEEPENSLDLGAAEVEARRFANFAERKDTQVFITSHSPAFYLSDVENAPEIRRFFIARQKKSINGEIFPKNAASLIDRLDDAEVKMEGAGLMQLPFVIRRMGEQRESLRAKEFEAEKLRNDISELKKPTLFVEGPHDVRMFGKALERAGAANDIAIKPLGGTPQSTSVLLQSVLQQGGFNAAAQTLFLFDNDKAGRGAYRSLVKESPLAQPKSYQDDIFAWVIPRTDEFNRFMRRIGIKPDQAFFTAEFLYPIDEALEICEELIIENNIPEKVKLWRESINGDYWPSIGQEKCSRLQHAENDADWFYARGVPDFLKLKFAEVVEERAVSTEEIDVIMEKVQDRLLK